MTEWLLLSLFAAIDASVYFFIIKKITRDINPLIFLFLSNFVSIPFLLLFILYFGGFPNFNPLFFFYIGCSAILDAIAFYFTTLAIKSSEISFLAPISAFTPIFVTIFAAIGLREIPSPLKLTGVLVIVTGTYLLNVSEIKNGGILAPLKKLINSKSVQQSFVAYFIWGITPIFQKQAILQTSPQNPLAAAFIGTVFVALIYSLFVLKSLKKQSQQIKKHFWIFILIGIISAPSVYASFKAFSLTNIAYPSAIFKLSALFTILGGGLFFKETHIKERLVGATIMVLGTILLAF